MKKILMTVLILTLCLSVFAGGQTEQAETGGPVTLRFTTWTSNETQLALFSEMADEFNKSQNDYQINLKIDSLPFGEYVQKVTLQLSGSNPPDIGWLVETSAPAFVNAGVLLDLSSALAPYNFEDFSKGAMGLWTRGDKTFGVPFSTSPFIIIYNKTQFEKAGISTPTQLAAEGAWTWEKFRETSKLLHDRTGMYGFQGVDGAAYTTRTWHNLVPMIRGFGGEVWDENGNVLIDRPEAVKAVQLFHDMVYVDGSVVPPGDLSDFYAGNAAMTVGQISRVSKLDAVEWEWDVAPMPEGPAKGQSQVIGQAAVVAFSAGKNKDAAAAFLAFMTNKENVTKMAKYWPPARQSVMESAVFVDGNPYISSESMMSAVVPGLKFGRVLPSHEKFPQIDLAASAEFDKLWNKDADVKAVLASLAAAIRANM